jgi:Protein of unknown function (DUF2452)
MPRKKTPTAPLVPDFINPIDKDKVAENPGLLPYAHTVSGPVIKPMDKGRTKGLSLSAMYDQTDMQLDQIKQQIELLAKQAKAIQDRKSISEVIYQADCGFKPIINHTYHLYRKKKDDTFLMSMIAPDDWGGNAPYIFVATIKLLADHTWDILEKSEDFE